MTHTKLTFDLRTWSADLDIRSEDKFTREQTEAINALPQVTGVFAPSPRHLQVGLTSKFEEETVRGEIWKILNGGER